MSAIRLARGFTGRHKIVKFEGCYHGHSDSLLVKAGSGALTLGVPTSPGVPPEMAAHTITLAYNDIAQVQQAFNDIGREIACVIVEPIAGNMNCVPPVPGFLEALRSVCDQHGSVLIFDEVMTGFRVALGGAQALYGIKPDLTTLGKIVGGGMPTPLGIPGEVAQDAYDAKLSGLGPVDIVGTHVPPRVPWLCYDTVGERFEPGSDGLIAYIQTHHPRLALYGHVHQPLASRGSIGTTELVNVGHFAATGEGFVYDGGD